MTNYESYKRSLQYIETRQVNGFRLYALEDYPYAVKSTEATDSIVVEIFKIVSESAKQNIHELELSAGYIFETIEVENRSVGIYLFERAGNNMRVNDGDWVKFFGIKTK